jgi:hypothetical protein
VPPDFQLVGREKRKRRPSIKRSAVIFSHPPPPRHEVPGVRIPAADQVGGAGSGGSGGELSEFISESEEGRGAPPS